MIQPESDLALKRLGAAEIARRRDMYSLRLQGLTLEEIGLQYKLTRQRIDQLLNAGSRFGLFEYPLPSPNVPRSAIVEAVASGSIPLLMTDYNLSNKHVNMLYQQYALTPPVLKSLRDEYKRKIDFDEYKRIVEAIGGHPGTRIIQSISKALYNRIIRHWGSIAAFRGQFGIPKPAFGYQGDALNHVASDLKQVDVEIEPLDEDVIQSQFPESVGQTRAAALSDVYAGPKSGTRRRLSLVLSRIGQLGFKNALLSIYPGECAFCGFSLTIGGGNPLEASHVVGVADGGTTHVKNGLLLCRLDHWLLDRGFISISSEHRVLVTSRFEINDRSNHLETLRERPISQPSIPKYALDEAAAAGHRTKHGFSTP
jgi:hypothetical protein